MTDFDRVPKDRIVRLYGKISDSREVRTITPDRERFMAESVFESLIKLGNISREPVSILIYNAGGNVEAGLTIVSGIEHLQAKGVDVQMLALGPSLSMASIILAAGTIGKRYALARSTVHFHAPYFDPAGLKPEEIEKRKARGERLAVQLRNILATRTNIPEYWRGKQQDNTELITDPEVRVKWVREFLSDERYLSAEEALKARVIDAVLKPGDARLDTIFKLERSAE
ncbi:MAG: ATP-dependent Clp protease proteolytic subunit [bacterium]|nr:ATP-dependent Clp protease proteolytic subunit [bacterium]